MKYNTNSSTVLNNAIWWSKYQKNLSAAWDTWKTICNVKVVGASNDDRYGTDLHCVPHAYRQPKLTTTWWRHKMETFSALLAICAGNSPVHGEFPTQRPVTPSFDAFFDLHLNKQLSKQWWGWWFETLWRPLWRHRNEFAPIRWLVQGHYSEIDLLLHLSLQFCGRFFLQNGDIFIISQSSVTGFYYFEANSLIVTGVWSMYTM